MTGSSVAATIIVWSEPSVYSALGEVVQDEISTWFSLRWSEY